MRGAAASWSSAGARAISRSRWRWRWCASRAAVIAEARIGVGGAEHRPRRIEAAEQVLVGASASPQAFAAAGAEAGAAVAAALEPTSDIHASAEYRRDLAQVMTRRALAAALA